MRQRTSRSTAAPFVTRSLAAVSVALTLFLLLGLVPTLGLTSCSGGVGAGAAEGGATVPVAYVASSGNNHVRVIDLESGETLRRLYTGAAPWRLVPSPDGRRLWVQHWYAGTTAVVDLEDHEVAAVLPYRGPGTFAADGSAFLTFDWPGSDLVRVEDAGSDRPREGITSATMIKQAYDVTLGPAPDPSAERLYAAQFDPIAKGPVPRYSAIGVVETDRLKEAGPPPESGERPPAPASVATGRSPVRVVAVPGEPFVLTADSETNGITVINELGDRRALAVCPAPKEIAIAPDRTRMAVVCWNHAGRHASRVVTFRTDFAARPWPEIEKDSETEVPGGLVAAAFDPAGGSLYAADRRGGRLLELSLPGLEVTRELDTGEEPLDVEVIALPATARDRLRSGEGRSRTLLRRALESARAARGGGFRDLSWTETITWYEEPEEAAVDEEAEAGEEGDGRAVDDASAEPIERSREVRIALRPPDAVRTEIPEGGVRISRAGTSVSLDADGRFWTAPRQDISGAVYALGTYGVDEAIRQLAGDVPGSPFLRGGIAVDVISEVEESGERFWVIGARPEDPEEAGRVAQLWIEVETGLPVSLVEQFPVFATSGHSRVAAPEVAETKYHDFEEVGGEGGPRMPRTLERVVDGEWVQQVRLDGFRLDAEAEGEPSEALFDPARLGGVRPSDAVFRSSEAVAPAARRPDGEPGRPVPVHHPPAPVASPLAPHAPYTTSPPTSGPYLPFTGDWGAHTVPVPLPLQAHHLLDGGVALQYRCPDGCPDLVSRLEEVARSHDFVLVAPYPWMESRLSLTAWGRMLTMDAFDGERVERFVEAYAGRDHHAEGPATGAVPSH